MNNKVKLYCVPYAGGSAVAYYTWKKYLGEIMELRPLELAGRGRRFKEPIYSCLIDAAEDLYQIIKDDVDDGPYALFGHSMGNLIIYELAKKLIQGNHLKPAHLFFSGRKPPHVETKKYGSLTGDELIDELMELGGITDEFIQNPELMEVYLPIIRADLINCDTYVFEKRMEFDSNITVYYGEEDELTKDGIDEWSQYTKRGCRLKCFPGGHFFLFQEPEMIVKDIINILAE